MRMMGILFRSICRRNAIKTRSNRISSEQYATILILPKDIANLYSRVSPFLNLVNLDFFPFRTKDYRMRAEPACESLL